ncbi:MAG: NAD(P)-binding protein, partial [Pseudonocardiaceae bacterium]
MRKDLHRRHQPHVVIIGTGFGGLGMAIELKRAGIDAFTILEKAFDVGGVWRENTYPGAACDIPAPYYSFSYEPNPAWPSRFSR